MNPTKTHLESCGWQSVAIHPDHVGQPRFEGDDRGWTLPFSVPYLSPQCRPVVDGFTNLCIIEKPALV